MLSENKQAAKLGRARKEGKEQRLLPVEVGFFLAAYWIPGPWVGQPNPQGGGRLTFIPCIFQSSKPIQLIWSGPRGPAGCIPVLEPDSECLWNLDGSFSSWLPCCHQRVSH